MGDDTVDGCVITDQALRDIGSTVSATSTCFWRGPISGASHC